MAGTIRPTTTAMITTTTSNSISEKAARPGVSLGIAALSWGTPWGSERSVLDQLAIGTMTEESVDARIDLLGEEADRAVAEREVGPAGVRAPEAADEEIGVHVADNARREFGWLRAGVD